MHILALGRCGIWPCRYAECHVGILCIYTRFRACISLFGWWFTCETRQWLFQYRFWFTITFNCSTVEESELKLGLNDDDKMDENWFERQGVNEADVFHRVHIFTSFPFCPKFDSTFEFSALSLSPLIIFPQLLPLTIRILHRHNDRSLYWPKCHHRLQSTSRENRWRCGQLSSSRNINSHLKKWQVSLPLPTNQANRDT